MRTLKIRRFQPRLLMGENSRHFIRSQLSSSYEIKKSIQSRRIKKNRTKQNKKWPIYMWQLQRYLMGARLDIIPLAGLHYCGCSKPRRTGS